MGVGSSGGGRDGYVLRVKWSRKRGGVCQEHLGCREARSWRGRSPWLFFTSWRLMGSGRV